MFDRLFPQTAQQPYPSEQYRYEIREKRRYNEET